MPISLIAGNILQDAQLQNAQLVLKKLNKSRFMVRATNIRCMIPNGCG